MTSRKRSIMLLLAFALALPVVFLLAPSPAYAQDAGGQPWYSMFTNYFTSTPVQFNDVYTQDQQWLNTMGCWGCTIFDSFVSGVLGAGQNVSAQMDGGMKAIMVAFASVFGLFYLGGSFVAGDASDLAQRWKVFWRLCIAVAVGGAWLSGGSFNKTWDYVYSPIMSVPIAIETAVGGGGSTDCGGGPSNVPSGAQASVTAMRGVVCGANHITMDNIARGMAVFQTGSGFSDNIAHWVAGAFMVIIFAWLMIAFPLRFIDVILRLAIVGIVTPVMVVCAVFKPTRGYCLVAVNNVLNAACQFAFTGIMFKLGNTFFNQLVQQYSPFLVGGAASPSSSQMIIGVVVLCSGAMIFGSMVKMAPIVAGEFAQFNASAGGVGGTAEGIARSVTMAPVNAGGAAVGAVGGAAGTLATGALAYAGYSGMKKALGKGISKSDGKTES